MTETQPANPVDPVTAVTSLLAHAHELAPVLCPSLYPAGYPSDVTDILQSKGLDISDIVNRLHAADRSIGSCSPDTSRVVSVFTVDASRRIFKFAGLRAVPAHMASFVHCDTCTNEVNFRCSSVPVLHFYFPRCCGCYS
jgi:hypothetical protein